MSKGTASGPRSLAWTALRFYALVLGMSAPFWLLGSLIKLEGLPDNLPVTDVGATFVPLAAGLIIALKEGGAKGARKLLGRIADFRKLTLSGWLIALLGMPIVYAITYAAMRTFGLEPSGPCRIEASTLILYLGFFLAAIGEEAGYMGYAIDKAQERLSPLLSGALIGAFWAAWHLPSMIRLGQSAGLIAIGLIATVAFRIIYVWFYNRTCGCVFGAILLHATANTGRSAFPGGRSYYEELDGIVGYSIIALLALVIALLSKDMLIPRNRRYEERSGSLP